MKSTIFFLLSLSFIYACSKPVIDYRRKYVGTYHVVSYNSSWMMGQGYNYDTVSYDIRVERANSRYYLSFVQDFGESYYLIETDGTLHYESNDWHYHVNGSFTDQNHFQLTGGYYGLGGGNSFDARGTKQ